MSEEEMVDRCCIKYEKFWSILRGCTARINGEGKRCMCVRELARGSSNYGDWWTNIIQARCHFVAQPKEPELEIGVLDGLKSGGRAFCVAGPSTGKSLPESEKEWLTRLLNAV